MPSTDSRSEIVLALAEEFLDRYRQGERPALKEYIDRHPELAADIREAFPAMAMMENIALADESIAENQLRDREGTPPLQQLGDYRIIREVGRGGMGVVYEAEQVSLGRHVALKVLPRKMLLDPKQRRRFEREAKAAAKLHHTNIVPVFGVGEQEGLPYYVMQFIQGLGLDEVLAEVKRLRAGGPSLAGMTASRPPSRGDLSAAAVARSLVTGTFEPAADSDDAVSPRPESSRGALSANAPLEDSGRGETGASSGSSISLPGQTQISGRTRSGRKATYWQSVAQIGLQVAEALDYAHRQGVLHRDIKPSNLLLDLRGTVWVADFGLAKADDSENLTHTGDILGTLRYMPPEAFEGKSDGRTDVYALGLTLYELLALKPAFGDKDRLKLIDLVKFSEPTRLGKLNAAIPRDLQTIVHKAIEKDPSHRYATSGELAEDLRRYVEDEPIKARRISVVERAMRWCRRNPALAGMMAAVVMVTAMGVATSLWHAKRANDNAAQALISAEAAKKSEERANVSAEDAKRSQANAEAQREEQRLANYAASMGQMPRAWEGENFQRTLALLESHRPRLGGPDLRGFEYDYWKRLAHTESTAFRPMAGFPLPGTLSDDGSRFVSILNGPQIWDVATGRQLRYLPLTPNTVLMASRVSQDGRRIVEVRGRFDPEAARRGGGRGRGGVQIEGSTLHVIAVDSGSEIYRRDFRSAPMALSPDGKKLAFMTIEGNSAVGQPAAGILTVIEVDSGRTLNTIPIVSADAFAFSPDGTRLIEATYWSSRTDGGRGRGGAAPAGPTKPDELAVHDLTTNTCLFRGAIPGLTQLGGRLMTPDNRRLIIEGWVQLPGSTPLPTGNLPWTSRVVFVDAQTGKAIPDMPILSNYRAFDASPDGTRLALIPMPQGSQPGGSLMTLKVLDGNTGQELKPIPLPASFTWALRLSADGKKLAGYSSPSTVVHVWDIATGTEIWTIRGQTSPISQVAFNADGTHLVIVDNSGTVKTWDLTKQPELAPVPPRLPTPFAGNGRGPISRGLLSQGSRRGGGVGGVLGGGGGPFGRASSGFLLSSDGQRSLVATTTPNEEGSAASQYNTMSLALSDELGQVIARSEWQAAGTARGGQVSALLGQSFTPPPLVVALSPNGSKYAALVQYPQRDDKPTGAGGRRGQVWTVWDAASGRKCELEWPAGRIVAPAQIASAFSLDGKLFALTNIDNRTADGLTFRTVTVWDTATGRILHDRQLSADLTPVHVVFAPDGRRLAVGGIIVGFPNNDSAISVIELADKKEHGRLALPQRTLAAMAYSPDNKWLAGFSTSGRGGFGVGGRGSTFGRGRGVGPFDEGDLSFNQGVDLGEFVDAINRVGGVTSAVGVASGFSGVLGAVALNASGATQVADVLYDQLGGIGGGGFGVMQGGVLGGQTLPEVYVWNVATGAKEPRTLAGHVSDLRDLAFSPDGRRMATLGSTQTNQSEVKIWDPATGQELLTLTELGRLLAIRFSADGHKLYVFDNNGRRTYDAMPLPLAIEALDVADTLVPATSPEDILAQLAKLQISNDLKDMASKLTPIRRNVGPGGPGRIGGPAAAANVIYLANQPDESYRRVLEQFGIPGLGGNIAGLAGNPLPLVRSGAVHYRLREYKEALTDLLRARDLAQAVDPTLPHPGTTAFLAMTHYRLDHLAEAHSALAQLKRELDMEPFASAWATMSPEMQAFYKEPEALIEGKK